MKALKYEKMTEINQGTPEEPFITHDFTVCWIPFTESNRDVKMQIAQAEAYGEVTVEDLGPDVPTKFTLPLSAGCVGSATYEPTAGGIIIEADVTTTYHIGTLPYGFRPSADRKIQATCPGGPGVIVIAGADGIVRLETPSAAPLRVVFRDQF